MPGVPNAYPPIEHIKLDRSQHANYNFNNWTLTNDIVKDQNVINLETQVPVPAMEEMDYVHARYEALHNHITSQPRFNYFFQSEPGAALQLCTLDVDVDFSSSPATFDSICALEPAPLPDGATSLISSPLHPSVAEITTPATTSTTTPQLLVSSGHGDIYLVTQQLDAEPVVSEAIYPLRSAPPLQGVRPLHLEAAFLTPGGAIVAICWAVHRAAAGAAGGSGGTRASAVCQVYTVTLKPLLLQLEVMNVQLLKSSSMPPHAVLVNPYSCSVLLALEPKDDVALESGSLRGRGSSGTAVGGDAVDDADDPVSPRTLKQAVERLEQYTSDTPDFGIPREGCTDVFHESGPDNVGTMGAEPTVSLVSFRWREREGGEEMKCEDHVSCLPHRLLSCQLYQDGSPGGCLLLGLTDDVDCAVLHITAIPSPAEDAALTTLEREEGDVSRSIDPILQLHSFAAKHITSIPALAYIAAGKIAKKFLLVTPLACTTAAVLIESFKYAYLYRRTRANSTIGQQQVVEMNIPGSYNASVLLGYAQRGQEVGPGGGILGAVAVPLRDGGTAVVLLTSQAILNLVV